MRCSSALPNITFSRPAHDHCQGHNVELYRLFTAQGTQKKGASESWYPVHSYQGNQRLMPGWEASYLWTTLQMPKISCHHRGSYSTYCLNQVRKSDQSCNHRGESGFHIYGPDTLWVYQPISILVRSAESVDFGRYYQSGWCLTRRARVVQLRELTLV